MTRPQASDPAPELSPRVHVYAPPDEGALADDEAICSERDDALVTFHSPAVITTDGFYVCCTCGKSNQEPPRGASDGRDE